MESLLQARSNLYFSTPPPRQLSRNSQGAGLGRASTLPLSEFNQDPLIVPFPNAHSPIRPITQWANYNRNDRVFPRTNFN
jgi:hypothetical protein